MIDILIQYLKESESMPKNSDEENVKKLLCLFFKKKSFLSTLNGIWDLVL